MDTRKFVENATMDVTDEKQEEIAEESKSDVMRFANLEPWNAKNNDERFDTFDENIFSEKNLPGKCYSQRALTLMVRDKCRQWADTYPDIEIRNILFMGQTGLGKTFLMHAMADRLIKRGKDVLMISANRFFEMVRIGYFNDHADKLSELMDSDILMLDDLESEQLIQNITEEQLFNLICKRQSCGKATVISTKMNKSEFCERCSERILSYLMDARESITLTLLGDDVRIGK